MDLGRSTGNVSCAFSIEVNVPSAHCRTCTEQQPLSLSDWIRCLGLPWTAGNPAPMVNGSVPVSLVELVVIWGRQREVAAPAVLVWGGVASSACVCVCVCRLVQSSSQTVSRLSWLMFGMA